MEWVKIENSFFDQDPKNNVEEPRWMPLDEAKEKVLANPQVALGICAQQGDESNMYCAIVKIGTAKYASPGCPFDCYVYKKTLPDEDLYEDDFAEDGWVRPGRGEGLGDECQELLLFSGVDPNDLGQGGLGDCWLISAMAAFAEFPDEVMAIFDRKTLSEEGRYVITLYSYEHQQKIPIEIDDRFPADGGNFQNCVMTESGEIWPCLLEKAFAKYSGSYDELAGGQPTFAFGALTGCTDLVWYSRQDDEWKVLPSQYTSNKIHDWTGAFETGRMSDAEMLSELDKFDKQNYLMGCASEAGCDSDTNSQGVVQGHAYSLISVKMNCAGSDIDLLCLRNPWGKSEWTGDWSDKSDLWDENQEVAAECGHTEDEDGMFWISWEDFCANYPNIYVCKKTMSEPARGKTSIEINKQDIITGKIEDRPPKESPGIERNRQSNTVGTCMNQCVIS